MNVSRWSPHILIGHAPYNVVSTGWGEVPFLPPTSGMDAGHAGWPCAQSQSRHAAGPKGAAHSCSYFSCYPKKRPDQRSDHSYHECPSCPWADICSQDHMNSQENPQMLSTKSRDCSKITAGIFHGRKHLGKYLFRGYFNLMKREKLNGKFQVPSLNEMGWTMQWY